MPRAVSQVLRAAVGGSPGSAAYDVTTAPARRSRSSTRAATCPARARSSAPVSRVAARALRSARRAARRADFSGDEDMAAS